MLAEVCEVWEKHPAFQGLPLICGCALLGRQPRGRVTTAAPTAGSRKQHSGARLGLELSSAIY